MGKGSKRRPCLISKEEEDLRWRLFQGKISIEEFNQYIFDKMMEIKKGA